MTRAHALQFSRVQGIARRAGGSALFLAILATGLATAQAADTKTKVAEFRRSADASAAEARGLEARRPSVISGSIVMNTVRQFPKRNELDGYLQERTKEARAWEAKVAAGEAQRTVVANPYTRSTYTKYYDDKGDWQFSVIEKDYRATEKLQEDWSREFRRARATLEGLQRDYDGLVAEGGLQAAQQSEIAAMLTSATERMGQFGSPPPELLPRPVEGDTNSPYPSFRAYDSFTGQLIDIGSTGKSRPVEGEPTAGSRPTEPPPPSNPPAGGGPALAGRTWNVTWPLTGAQRYPLAISLEPGGKAYGYYGTKNQFHSPSRHDGTWREQGGVVTVVLQSSGRPGYSSYSEGFTVTGRLGQGGNLEVTDVRRP